MRGTSRRQEGFLAEVNVEVVGYLRGPLVEISPDVERPEIDALVGMRLHEVSSCVEHHIQAQGAVLRHVVGQQALGEVAGVLPAPTIGQFEHERTGRIHDLARVRRECVVRARLQVRALHDLVSRVLDAHAALVSGKSVELPLMEAVPLVGVALGFGPVLRDGLHRGLQR